MRKKTSELSILSDSTISNNLGNGSLEEEEAEGRQHRSSVSSVDESKGLANATNQRSRPSTSLKKKKIAIQKMQQGRNSFSSKNSFTPGEDHGERVQIHPNENRYFHGKTYDLVTTSSPSAMDEHRAKQASDSRRKGQTVHKEPSSPPTKESQLSEKTGTASASSSLGKTDSHAVKTSPPDGLSEREENESIQIIKAKTMFEMVDDVTIGDNLCKVLLLSNGQAKELAQSRSFDKLIAALEIKEYSCVINLLESGGFEECLKKWDGSSQAKQGLQGRDKIMAGLVPNRPAFVSKMEEREAIEKIDIFMEKVIVPLAIETHAIVITRAIRGDSILSESFTRIYRILRSKFSEKEPFHVISIVDQIIPLYAHPDFDRKDPKSNKAGLHWVKVQNGSKTWQARQRKILDVAGAYWEEKKNNKRFWDFDPYATCYVIGEGIDYGSKECLKDAVVCSQPFNRFMTAFNTYLSYKVPSLALATGFTEKRKLSEDLDKSLAYPLNLSLSGSKVLLLDVRKRKEISKSDLPTVSVEESGRRSWHRGTGTDVRPLLEFAQNEYTLACDNLLAQGLAECFDICTLAYFKSMLGNSLQEGVGCFGWKKNSNKPTQATYKFEPGKMGITYDDHGFVEKTSRGGQARVKGVAKGSQVVKIRIDEAHYSEKFSRDAVVKAEKSRAPYEVTVKVWPPPRKPTPLHEALADGLQAKKDRAVAQKDRTSDESDEEHMGKAANIPSDLTADLGALAGSLASWIAHRTFKDAFEVLPKSEKKKRIEDAKLKHDTLIRDIQGNFETIRSNTHTVNSLSDISSVHRTQPETETQSSEHLVINFERPYEILFKERIFAMETWARSILSSDKIAVANLYDIDETKQLVNSLVCKSRLPAENSFEGLQLIHQAWIDHDVAIYLASYYKTMSKILFTLQLTVAWMVMVISSVFPSEADVLFTLTAFCGILVPIESIFSSNARWRHLRSSAGELQSMIWCYRTRVGDFEIDPVSARRADLVFKENLNAWRDELISGANIDKSTLARPYGDTIFKHQQKRGRPNMIKFKDITGKLKREEECDDHYSPQGPYEYIEKRLLPAIDFYQKRIPRYGYQCIGTRLVLVVCAVAASFLTKYGLITYVGAVTAFGSAITTWSEYTDAERKLSRYTRVVRDLQRQLNWWRSLTDLEEAGSENIRLLVTASEEIISQERLGWAARKRLLNTDPASQQQLDGQGLNDDSK